MPFNAETLRFLSPQFRVGYGTWQAPDELTEAGVYNAIKIGYRQIDCAHIYGNQKAVGRALQRAFADGLVKREDLWITSKVWNDDHKNVAPAIEIILKDLQLDYLDLLLIHWPISFVKDSTTRPHNHDDSAVLGAYKEMEKAVAQGKVKNLGISNFTIEETRHLWNNVDIKPITNQVEAHPYWNQFKLEKELHALNMVLTAYSPLCGNIPDPSLKIDVKNLLEDARVVEIAKKHNVSPALVCLRWHLDVGNRIVLPKSVTPSRIAENFKINDFELDQDDLSVLNNIPEQWRSLNPIGWRVAGEPFFADY